MISRFLAAIGAAMALACVAAPAAAQLSLTPAEVATDVSVVWEVKNRFRLFRDERDFNRHLAVTSGRSILAAEQTLAQETGGRGWARDTVLRLCVGGAGRVVDNCVRGGVRESYLTPTDHRVTVKLAGQVPAGATCAWTFENGEGTPRAVSADCREDVNLRVRYGKLTAVTVEIAALGDSIAAGEGNPDRPVALSDEGFCFRTFNATARSEYFRPGRIGYKGDKARS